MECEVRSPKNGYDNDDKSLYRHDVWSCLAPATIHNLSNPNAYWLIMPSREGLEIDVAVSYGIPADRIVCVDQSAAVIATSGWRKRWPSCKFFASKISDVGGKLKKKNMVIAAANLDLCGNFSEETIDEIDAFVSEAPLVNNYALAITMMKGREGSALVRVLSAMYDHGVTPFREKRINALFSVTCMGGMAWRKLKEGSYTSSKMPVSWAAIQCVNNLGEDVEKEIFDYVKKAAEAGNSAYDAYYKEWIEGDYTKKPSKKRTATGLSLYQKWCDMREICDDCQLMAERVMLDAASGLINYKIITDYYYREMPCRHREIMAQKGRNRSAFAGKEGSICIPKTPAGWKVYC